MQCSVDTLQIIATFATLITISSCSAVSSGGSSSSSSGNSGSSGAGHLESNPSSYYTDSVYRNLDTQLLRIGSRLDQLMIRMDHLDSRVARVQSTGHLRFDSIETSMQTTRQRLDLWSNQLNMIEEQLTRKWKNMESRFDSLVSTLDSKLDSKFNLIQRDNRRHNEFITQSVNAVMISQEKFKDRIGTSINEMNSTLLQTQSVINSSTSTTKSHSSTCLTRLDNFLQNLTSSSPQYPYHNSPSMQQTRRASNNMIQPTDQLPFPRPPLYSSYYSQPPQQNSTPQLISSKVSNMFDELVKRSHDLEAIVKDTFTMSNMTRREVQDGFMALIPIVSQVGLGNEKSSGASGEVMSMVVEMLSSAEQMSTSLGRRMAELNRSIKERFDMVSMTLNGFLESCIRIQERTPQLEEGIVDILLRILDSVDNSTRNATETWQKVKLLLTSTQPINTTNCTNNLIKPANNVLLQEREQVNNGTLLLLGEHDTGFNSLMREYESLQQTTRDEDEYDNNNEFLEERVPPVNHQQQSRNNDEDDVQVETGGGRPLDRYTTNSTLTGMSEEQKKMMWESLRLTAAAEEEHVPE